MYTAAPPPSLVVDQSGRDAVSDQTRSLVFGAILSQGQLSRTKVANRLKLSASTVTKVVAPLVESGYLVETGLEPAEGRGGRPQRMLAVNVDRHMVLGVKLSPASVTAVRTDLGARVVARARRRLRSHRPGPALDAAIDAVRELTEDVDGPPPLGLGVGLGGHVQAGRCVHSGVLGWADVDIAGPLATATGLSTVVNNDVNTLVAAEYWFGKGRDSESFALITIGTGIGCGLLLNGQLYAGATGLAGELGHLPLVPDGPQCTCGNRGCLEAVAGDAGILAMLRDAGVTAPSIKAAMRMARSGEPAAIAAFETAGAVLGRGLATVSNLLNVEKIILSGEGVTGYDLLGPALEQSWHAHAFSSAARDCELIVDSVDDDLWARGAACLVIHQAVHGTPA